MKWKTFFQIVLLMIIGALLFYLVCPKYFFYTNAPLRANKITGEVEKKSEDNMWELWAK